MDEPEREDPQQPGDGPASAPTGRADAVAPPTWAYRVRGALAGRAAGWVVAVALAGAVVALSAVLAASPRGLQAQAFAGPVAITAVPEPAIVTGPGQVRISAVPPGAFCVLHARPGTFRVALPAGPGKVITASPVPVTVTPGKVTVRPGKVMVRPGAVMVRPGAVTLMPAVVCPPR